MKHKNKLIVPTLITTSLLTSSLVANADEIADETSDRTEGEITVGEEIKQENTDYDINELSNQETDPLETESVPTEETIHNERAITEETVNEVNPEDKKSVNIITEDENILTEVVDQNIVTSEIYDDELANSDQKEQLLKKDTFENSTDEKTNHKSLDQVSEDNSKDKLLSEEQNTEDTKSENNKISMEENKEYGESEIYGKSVSGESDEQNNNEITLDTTTNSDIEVHEERKNEKDVLPTPKDYESNIRTLSSPAQVASFSSMSLKPDIKKTPAVKTVNYATRIKGENNSGLYSPVTSKKGKNAGQFLKQTLFISESTKVNGDTYYKILKGLDGPMQGWMKQSDLDTFNIYNHQKHNETLYVDSRHKNDYLFADPYGTSKQHIKKIKDTGSSTFKTKERIKVGAVTFYYGTLGNSEGWLSESRLTKQSQPDYSSARFAARISNQNNNSGIYSPITSNDSISAKRFNNSTLFISEKAYYSGTTYYKIHNGLEGAMQGWMKENDLQTFGLGKVRNHNGSYSVKHDSFDLFSDPYGNSSQRIGSLKNYKNTPFKAEKSIKIGATTHYYGGFGKQKGWVSDAALTKYTAPKPPVSSPKVQNVKYDRSLNSVLNTQMSLSAKPQAWVNGGGWRNATRSEVKRFLDTSHQKGGAWDYTFLNLNQRQGISSSVLNHNILNNKGILTNRGNAFSQAAKQHGINEVYLISHAILETGHGSSQLAQGVKLDHKGNRSSKGTTYYNMYGIGAVDHNALLGGARYAQKMGWNTPEKAIIGGAGFVSSNYFARGQNTLYSMRWNPRNPGTYQYATDVNWAYATGRNLQNYYNQLGIRGKYFTRHTF